MPADDRDFTRNMKALAAAMQQLRDCLESIAQHGGYVAACMDNAAEAQRSSRRVGPEVDSAMAILNTGEYWLRQAFDHD